MSTRILKAAIGALAVMAASSLQAEVIEQGDDGFVTRDMVVVDASPMETWVALITPSKYWNPAHSWSGDAANMSIRPQGGGCFCERLPAKEDQLKVGLAGSVEHMRVILARPEQVLRMRGGLGPLQSEPAQGVLTVTLKQVDGGTRILWEYVVGGYTRFDVPVISKAVDGVMSEQLNRLANHLGPVESATKEPTTDEQDAAGAEGEAPEGAEDAATDSPDPAEDEAASKPSVEEAFEDLN